MAREHEGGEDKELKEVKEFREIKELKELKRLKWGGWEQRRASGQARGSRLKPSADGVRG